MVAKKKVLENRECKICNKTFTTEISNSRGRNRKTCGDRTCQDKLRLQTSYLKNCEICNNEYSTVRLNSKFCSDKCRKKRVKNNCQVCKKEFRADRPEIRFCSRECVAVSVQTNIKTTKCDYCNSDVSRSSNHIFKSKNNFCDSNCSNNYWGYKLFSGKSKYGGNWSTIRRDVIDFYDNECQKCNKSITLKNCNIHHIIPIKYYKEEEKDIANSIENLVPLCKECHKSVHRKNNEWYESNFKIGEFLKI